MNIRSIRLAPVAIGWLIMIGANALLLALFNSNLVMLVPILYAPLVAIAIHNDGRSPLAMFGFAIGQSMVSLLPTYLIAKPIIAYQFKHDAMVAVGYVDSLSAGKPGITADGTRAHYHFIAHNDTIDDRIETDSLTPGDSILVRYVVRCPSLNRIEQRNGKPVALEGGD
jgi:hypothetical protein